MSYWMMLELRLGSLIKPPLPQLPSPKRDQEIHYRYTYTEWTPILLSRNSLDSWT